VVADPGAGGAEFALVVAVAAGQRDDAFRAGPALLLEILEGQGYTDAELKLLLRFMTQGYTTMLAVTEELKARIEAPPKDNSKAKGKRG
jgi:hypothetical protein